MTIENDYQVLQQNLLLKDKVLGVINKVWEVTNSGESPDAIFSQILPMVLPILDCDYGFIAKINHLQSFQLCLKIYAQQCLSENSLQQDEYILYDDLPEEVMVLINSEQNILLNDLVSPLKISVKDTSVELNNLLGIIDRQAKKGQKLESWSVYSLNYVVNKKEPLVLSHQAFEDSMYDDLLNCGVVESRIITVYLNQQYGEQCLADFNATIAYGCGLPLDQRLFSKNARPFTVANHGDPVMQLFS